MFYTSHIRQLAIALTCSSNNVATCIGAVVDFSRVACGNWSRKGSEQCRACEQEEWTARRSTARHCNNLQTSEWQWDEEVFLCVKHVDRRELPLPQCTMTQQRLTDFANKAGQNTSEQYVLLMHIQGDRDASGFCACARSYRLQKGG